MVLQKCGLPRVGKSHHQGPAPVGRTRCPYAWWLYTKDAALRPAEGGTAWSGKAPPLQRHSEGQCQELQNRCRKLGGYSCQQRKVEATGQPRHWDLRNPSKSRESANNKELSPQPRTKSPAVSVADCDRVATLQGNSCMSTHPSDRRETLSSINNKNSTYKKIAEIVLKGQHFTCKIPQTKKIWEHSTNFSKKHQFRKTKTKKAISKKRSIRSQRFSVCVWSYSNP